MGKKVVNNVKKVTKWLPKGDQNRKKGDLSPFASPLLRHIEFFVWAFFFFPVFDLYRRPG